MGARFGARPRFLRLKEMHFGEMTAFRSALFGAALLLFGGSVARADTPSAAEIFAAENEIALAMRVEAAIARAQAAHGVITRDAAREITAKSGAENAPPDEVAAANAQLQHRMEALLYVWRQRLSDDAQTSLHFGVTTVDVYDTEPQPGSQLRKMVTHGDLPLEALNRDLQGVLAHNTHFNGQQVAGKTFDVAELRHSHSALYITADFAEILNDALVALCGAGWHHELDPMTRQVTSQPGLYVGVDYPTVVEAVAEGRRVAVSIGQDDD